MSKTKLAIITGGAKRIGAHLSRHLAENNWQLVIHYNESREEAQLLHDTLSKKTQVSLIQQDFSQDFNSKELFQKIRSHHQIEPSLLINNASSFNNEMLDDVTYHSFHKQMNIMCLVPMMLSKQMKQGNIINIIDQYALENHKNFTCHQIAKASLLKLTKQLAISLAPEVRVNALTLGPTMKGKNQKTFDDEIKKSLLGNAVRLEDICSSIDFLNKNESITGQNIILDCGRI